MLPSSSLLVLDFIQATNGVVINQNMEVCVNQFQMMLVWAEGGRGGVGRGGWSGGCKLGGKFCICNHGKMHQLLKGQYHGRYHDFGQKFTKFKL